jgi:hypothetical protein
MLTLSMVHKNEFQNRSPTLSSRNVCLAASLTDAFANLLCWCAVHSLPVLFSASLPHSRPTLLSPQQNNNGRFVIIETQAAK